MARRITEEQLTKCLLDWLEDNNWEIICFGFPQSGTGKVLHPNIKETDNKNKGAFIPDIVAIKNKIVLFFENKDQFVLEDYKKVNYLRSSSDYSLAIKDLLVAYFYKKIYYGIGIPLTDGNKLKDRKNQDLVDFTIMVNENKQIEVIYDPHSIFPVNKHFENFNGNIQKLESALHLKQLQINRLLNLTQAINNNISSRGLFDMYTSFLNWEMGVKKMALYFKDKDRWVCKAFSGVPEGLIALDISGRLSAFNRPHNIQIEDHFLLKEFDVVIPVFHKKLPLAYVFIGEFEENENTYNKVQFITTITNIIAVAIENKRLFKRQLEQERLKREMELASEMQRMLIPAELPCCEGYEFASIYRPHLGVGGDYFDVIRFDEAHFAFCVGDISGKGVAAALLMANFQANFHSLIRKRYPLDEFIRELNQSVLRITNGEKFITFFVAEYNTKTRTLSYINAGHNPPVLVHDDKVILLRKGCTILGSFSELPHIEIGEGQIKGRATILAYTDGLADVRNQEGDFLDTDMINEFTFQNNHLSAEKFNALLMKEIEQFKGELDYPDDFTILTCKIYE